MGLLWESHLERGHTRFFRGQNSGKSTWVLPRCAVAWADCARPVLVGRIYQGVARHIFDWQLDLHVGAGGGERSEAGEETEGKDGERQERQGGKQGQKEQGQKPYFLELHV